MNSERDLMSKELDALKENNRLLLETVAQQQRFLEDIDFERRARNVVMLGVPENADLPIEGQQTGAKTDEAKVKAILQKIRKSDVTITSMSRLGRKDDNNPRNRPIKVVFAEVNETQAVLSSAKNLKGGSYNDVRIKRDVHPAIRKEMGRLYQAERDEKEKPENQGRNVHFDSKKRILTIDGAVIDRFKPSFF